MAVTNTTAAESVKQIHYLAAALKAPQITEAAARLADQARDAGWSFEDYLGAGMEREASAATPLELNSASGPPGFPQPRDWTTSTSRPNQQSGNGPHWASGAFLTEARNIVQLGPPGTGKAQLATGLGVIAARHGHRVLFATATDWVTRLTYAHRAGRLPGELARLRRCGLIIGDEVGYLPFEQDAATLFFQLVSSRYEHASLVSTSNLPFSGWGGVFGDQAVAAATIDRIVHPADVITLIGASYRLPGRGIDSVPSIGPPPLDLRTRLPQNAHFQAPKPSRMGAPPTSSLEITATDSACGTLPVASRPCCTPAHNDASFRQGGRVPSRKHQAVDPSTGSSELP